MCVGWVWSCILEMFLCFSVTFFPFWCLKFLETLALLTKFYSQNHSINITILLFCFSCLFNCVVLYLIIFCKCRSMAIPWKKMRHEVVRRLATPLVETRHCMCPSSLIHRSDESNSGLFPWQMASVRTPQRKCLLHLRVDRLVFLLPVSMMSDCWTVILLNNEEHTSNSPRRAFASLFQRHYFPSRHKHVSYDQNGWDRGVIDPGRPIKHRHSAKTHPYANVFLELTSSESSFSF